VPYSHLRGDRSALLGGRGGRLMSPFCFTATPLQAPPSSAPSSQARTRRARGCKGEWPEPRRGRGAVCLHPHSPRGAERARGPAVRRLGDSTIRSVERLCFYLGHQKGNPSFLGPDPVSSPSASLPRGRWTLALTAQPRARCALGYSPAGHGVGLPVGARHRRP